MLKAKPDFQLNIVQDIMDLLGMHPSDPMLPCAESLDLTKEVFFVSKKEVDKCSDEKA